jgi:hypothetical protein
VIRSVPQKVVSNQLIRGHSARSGYGSLSYEAKTSRNISPLIP